MATKPVRVPDDTYEDVREIAAKLNLSLSQTTDLVLETGLQSFSLEKHLVLDPDLQRELTETLAEGDSEREIWELDEELHQRQIERNRERSELTERPQ